MSGPPIFSLMPVAMAQVPHSVGRGYSKYVPHNSALSLVLQSLLWCARWSQLGYGKSCKSLKSREESPVNFDEPRQMLKSSSSFWHVQIPRHAWPLTTLQSQPICQSYICMEEDVRRLLFLRQHIETAHKKNVTCLLDTVH